MKWKENNAFMRVSEIVSAAVYWPRGTYSVTEVAGQKAHKADDNYCARQHNAVQARAIQ